MGWFAPEERGLAIRQTAVPLGGAVASGVLPTLATHVSVRSSFFALAVGCFAASLVAAILLRAEPSGEPGEIGRPLRDTRVWRLCFGSTFYVMTQIGLVSFLVLFLWNGLSFTAAAEIAGRARSGAAIGLQQSFLSASAIVAPITFAAIMHHASWRLAFALAALSPLAGYAVLSPLSERRS